MDPPMNAPSKTIAFENGIIVSYDATELIVTVKMGNTQHKYKPQLILERANPPKT